MASRIDDSDLRSGLTAFGPAVEAALRIYAETAAKDFESYAKANRPWTDRTGRARQSLNGYVENLPNGVRINIAHGVDYGQFLEFAHEKKYAILEPTVRLKANDVLKGLREMFRKIKVK